MNDFAGLNSYMSDITNRRWWARLHECCTEKSFGVPIVCQHLEWYRHWASALTPTARCQQSLYKRSLYLHGHFRRIPTKCGNILLYPMKCQTFCKAGCYNKWLHQQSECSRSHSPRLPTLASLTSWLAKNPKPSECFILEKKKGNSMWGRRTGKAEKKMRSHEVMKNYSGCTHR